MSDPFADHGLFDDDTPVLVFEDPNIGEYPSIKYGMWLIVPVVFGLCAVGFVGAAAILGCSWRQEKVSAEHHGERCCER